MPSSKEILKRKPVQLAIAAVALALLLIVLGLFGVFGGHKASSANGPTDKEGAALDRHVADYNNKVQNPSKQFTLTFNEKGLVSGPKNIFVKKGDSVSIFVRVDKDEARVELQGYDLSTEVDTTSSSPSALRFIADKTGSFNVAIFGLEKPDANGDDQMVTLETPVVLSTVKVQ